MNYIVQLNISDAEDALDVAEMLAPLKGLEKVKVGVIQPRPEPRPQQPLQVGQAVQQPNLPPGMTTKPPPGHPTAS